MARMIRLSVGFLVLLAGAPRAFAEGARSPNALSEYHQQALGARFSFWSGLRLVKGSSVVPLGFFGGGRESIFTGSAAALESMDSYRKLRIAGTVMWAAGLAVLVAELVLLAADRDLFLEGGERIRPLFWGMLIPAGVVGIAGGIMMQGANGYLSDAVQQYNDDLYRRLAGGRAPGPHRWTLSVRQSF